MLSRAPVRPLFRPGPGGDPALGQEGGQELELRGHTSGRDASGGAEFDSRGPDVPGDGMRRQPQGQGDGFVALASMDAVEHFGFALSQLWCAGVARSPRQTQPAGVPQVGVAQGPGRLSSPGVSRVEFAAKKQNACRSAAWLVQGRDDRFFKPDSFAVIDYGLLRRGQGAAIGQIAPGQEIGGAKKVLEQRIALVVTAAR